MAERLSDEQFRVNVRRELGSPTHLDVTDEDINAMRVVINRHGYDDAGRCADLLWHLMSPLEA